MANIIAGLGAQLGLDTTEFKKGIAEAKNSLRELKEYLPEVLSVAGFYEMTKSALEFSDRIVETAKANEVATASVLELSKALEENGGNAEDTSRIYSGFTQKMESAVQGNAKAQESFAKLGVTLNDLRHLSEQDLFEKVINSLGNMKDAAERNGLAFETLGRSIRGVDLAGLAKSIQEGKGSMDEYAASVEKAHELSLKLTAAGKEMSLNFTNAVIPSLLAFYNEMTKSNGVSHVFFEALRIGMETVTILGERVLNTFKAIGMEIQHTFENAKILFTQGIDAAIADNKRYEKEVEEMAKNIATFESNILNPPKTEEKEKPKKEDINRPVIESYSKQILAEKELFQAYQNREQLNLEMLSQKEKDKNLTKNEVEMQKAIDAVLNEQQRTLNAIDEKMALIDKKRPGADALENELKRQKELVNFSTTDYIEQTRKVVAANQLARTDFWHGWDEAFAQYREGAETMADVGKKSFTTVVDQMSSALETFVKTGKLNFSDLAKSIIADLIAIQIKAQATQLFSNMFSGFGGGIFGGSTGPAPVETATPIMVSNATGGPLDAGQPSIVGENGPEVIVPRGNSTVIPNNQLGGMGSQTVQNVTNYNIQAIDTKSFEDRIYGSSGAIWAANQYATKNIATTRSRT